MKSMDPDFNPNHPGTAPPPYPGPPEPTSHQPFVSHNTGAYPTYPTYPNQSTVTVVHSQPMASGVQRIILANNMSPHPSPYTCPSCSMQIITRTEKKTTLRTHLCAALLCLTIMWPCALLPYCMDSCNNIDHYCPNCSAYLGTYMV